MSSSMPWIKLYTEMLDDPKIGRLLTGQKWRFVELLLLAGECDAEGYLVVGDEPMSLGDIAWRLRSDAKILETEMKELEKTGLIANDDGVWMIVKFSERQGRSQANKREKWRERKRRQRERERDEQAEQEENEECHADVTGDTVESHASREEESREDINAADASEEFKPPPKVKLNRNERNDYRSRLVKAFCIKTGAYAPRTATQTEVKAAQKLWWTPLDEIIDLARGDPDKAERLVENAVDRLDGVKGQLTDPNSIIKTARKVAAEGERRNGHIKTNADGSLYV